MNETVWLESISAPDIRKVPLESYPFSIGRTEVNDLCVNDTQVSRQHCVIKQEGEAFKIVDCGSTNGTSLNGCRIDEALLMDGDILSVADLQFTFRLSGGSSAASAAVTQVLSAKPAKSRSSTQDVILNVRKLNESLTRRGDAPRFAKIVSLESGADFGLELLPGADSDGETPLGRAESRLAGQLRHVQRLLAMETAAQHAPQLRLFLPVGVEEVVCSQSAIRFLELVQAWGSRPPLVVMLADAVVEHIEIAEQFCDRLHDASIEVGCYDFSASASRLEQLESIDPRYLKLAPAMTRSLTQSEDRQRRVQSVLEVCREKDIHVIAADVGDEQQRQALASAGCPLAQDALLDGASLSRPQRQRDLVS